MDCLKVVVASSSGGRAKVVPQRPEKMPIEWSHSPNTYSYADIIYLKRTSKYADISYSPSTSGWNSASVSNSLLGWTLSVRGTQTRGNHVKSKSRASLNLQAPLAYFGPFNEPFQSLMLKGLIC